MNKNDLVDAVAERTGLAKSDAARAVEAVLGTASRLRMPDLLDFLR